MSDKEAPEQSTPSTRKVPVPPLSWVGAFLEALRQCGTVRVAAEMAKVDWSTVYKHRARDEEFRRQWDEAIEQALDLLEFTAYRLARGSPGQEGQPPEPPSERMLIFLLQSRRRAVYGASTRLEHTGEGGGPVVVVSDAERLAALQRLHASVGGGARESPADGAASADGSVLDEPGADPV